MVLLMQQEKHLERKKTFQRNLFLKSKIQASVLSRLETCLRVGTIVNWERTQIISKIQSRTLSLSKKTLPDQSGEIQHTQQRLQSTQFQLHSKIPTVNFTDKINDFFCVIKNKK